jgi:hypothetical protein
MATPTKRNGEAERLVSRTYRTAIKVGEDFITLEETITLPLEASDEDVAKAVDLGWKIYQAQRSAVEAQITGVREASGHHAAIVIRDPDSPASDKQRNYIAALQEDLEWNNEQLAAYAGEQSVDLVTMTKAQASTFIDTLKKLAEQRAEYTPTTATPVAPRADEAPNEPTERIPANEKQVRALEQLARQHGLNLINEVQQRYGVAPQALSFPQASALLREWQQRRS